MQAGAILLSGGIGYRLPGDVLKQRLLLGGIPLYLHALRTLETSSLFQDIVVVCHPDWIEQTQKEIPHIRVVAGGSTRQESSYLGLLSFACPPDLVLMHDGVRPFVSLRILQENLSMAAQYGATDTCIPSTDTVVQSKDQLSISSIPQRASCFLGQTPQTFHYPLILQAHETAKRDHIFNATDDCSLVHRMGHPIYIVAGDPLNFKITHSIDWVLAQAIHAEKSGQKLD